LHCHSPILSSKQEPSWLASDQCWQVLSSFTVGPKYLNSANPETILERFTPLSSSGPGPISRLRDLRRRNWAPARCRCGRSQLREYAACIRGIFPSFGQKRVRAEIGSVPVLRQRHDRASRRSASDHVAPPATNRLLLHIALPRAKPLAPKRHYPKLCLPDKRIGTITQSKCQLKRPIDQSQSSPIQGRERYGYGRLSRRGLRWPNAPRVAENA
jgi:hypothetical protein